jgi:hypothetical protein
MRGYGPDAFSGGAPCAGAPPVAPVAGYKIVVSRVRVGNCGLALQAGVVREESTKLSVVTPTAYFGDTCETAAATLSPPNTSGTATVPSSRVDPTKTQPIGEPRILLLRPR